MHDIPIVAIIGPYRARFFWQRWMNIRRAKRMAREVWKLGLVAYLPHTMTSGLAKVIPEEQIMPGLQELATRCNVGLLVHGWEGSRGSLDEIVAMAAVGKPVFELLDDLKAWRALIQQETNDETDRVRDYR